MIEVMSGNRKELFEALGKMQSEMHAVREGSVNPYHNSKYADLATIMEYLRPLFAKYEFAFAQPLSCNGTDNFLEAYLVHSPSGQMLNSAIKIPANITEPQKLGAFITYMRRFQLSSLLGITTEEDDDGERAMGRDTKPAKVQSSKSYTPAPKPAVTPPPVEMPPTPPIAPGSSEDQKATTFNAENDVHKKIMQRAVKDLVAHGKLEGVDVKDPDVLRNMAKSLENNKVTIANIKDFLARIQWTNKNAST